MKPVHTWSDLQQFGINCLTGESCAYGMRLLCDLNEDGRKLVADYHGTNIHSFRSNWNSTVDGKPAVASVMLHRDSLQQIAIFAMFRAGALAAAVWNGETVPVESDERLAEYENYINNGGSTWSLRRNPALTSTAPREGSRNVHAASGRAT